MNRNDARRHVLAAGHRLLHERGVGDTAIGVDLKDAIATSGVAKSTAYRLFSDEHRSPQEVFAAEMVTSLLERGAHTDPALTIAAAAAVLEENPDLFDSGTPAQLTAVLRELIRRVTQTNTEAMIESVDLRVYVIALAATVDPGDTPEPGSVAASLVNAEAVEPAFLDMYREMAGLFGLRLRAGWTWAMFDAVTSSAAYGGALRSRFNPDVAAVMRQTGPEGELQAWSTLGVLFEGAVLVALEPNPRVVNAADPLLWLD